MQRALVLVFMLVFVLGGSVSVGAACEPAPAATLPAGKNASDISFVTEPPGAAVVVDGVNVGAGPITVKLNPGPHRVRASASGYYPTQESKIVVETGVATTHTLTLVASH